MQRRTGLHHLSQTRPLDGGERSAGELVAGLPELTQPAVSRHLRILRESGLVEARIEGQRRIYALRPQRLAEIDAWVARYRRYWPRHLDALERHLDRGIMTTDAEVGTLSVEGDVATLTYRRRLPHPVEEVWAALTDPGRRKAWFGQTTIEPRQGGMIEMMPDEPPAAPDAKRMTGRILVWDPPRVLEHEWRQRIVEDSVVRYELAPDGDGTLLVFTHRGLSRKNAEGFAPGGHAFLDRLEALLAGREMAAWNDRYAELAPAYPRWSARA